MRDMERMREELRELNGLLYELQRRHDEEGERLEALWERASELHDAMANPIEEGVGVGEVPEPEWFKDLPF